ncbi:MAG: polyribonucleotide nucleotidyltransferase [Armatimonadetes bacterium]|nr:polyribonucleotide nucleotidyltransferase [Armatimonadota bacterium]
MPNVHQVAVEIGGKLTTFETGELANQASGAVVVRQGDTFLLVTATMSPKARTEIDFFPLTCDYEERKYAIGRIPGGFIKRGGRPTDEAVIKSRLIDRSVRPLFPKGMRNEVQVVAMPYSVDYEAMPEMLALCGASAALSISNIPWNGPIAATRIGRIDGQLIVSPSGEQLAASDLNLVVASLNDNPVMIEADADEFSESEMLEAIDLAQRENQKIIQAILELQQKAGKEKTEVQYFLVADDLKQTVESQAGEQIRGAIQNADKLAREAALSQLKDEVVAQIAKPPAEGEPSPYANRMLELGMAVDEVIKKAVRSLIIDKGLRPDGRGDRDIRNLSAKVGVLPRAHGSGLFQRGQTQALTVCTLGSLEDAQTIDSLELATSKRYMHYYNFPPFSVGEARPLRSAGRREIGHGMLAERALARMIPDQEEFPYAVLLYSEILESNGSTSMAATCGSTLALMDAGVPIKAPVAGIATGLVTEGDQYKILTDIQGMEDAVGDMDFKVAGTANGITAIQLDIKIHGLPRNILAETLDRAKEARMKILDVMLATLPGPRPELSPLAPRIFIVEINPEKIGEVIGPGGKTVKRIIAETGCQIQIEQTGKIFIAAPDGEAGAAAQKAIEALTKEVAIGEVYTGRVTRLMNFGAFVELIPGKEGLVKVEDLSNKRVRRVDELVKLGDTITVRVREIDSQGRVNLSARGLDQTLESLKTAAVEAGDNPHFEDRAPRREDRGDRGDRGGRGRDFRGGRPPRRDEPTASSEGETATEELPKPDFRPKR